MVVYFLEFQIPISFRVLFESITVEKTADLVDFDKLWPTSVKALRRADAFRMMVMPKHQFAPRLHLF